MSAVEVIRIASEELEVELLPELGARLHRLRAFGTDLLRTPPDPAVHADDPFFWGAYVMAPWTNRASAGPMAVAGRTVDLSANFPDGTAIHGQVYVAAWQRTGEGTFGIEREGDGWPWAYTVTADVGVDGSRLRLRYRLVNRSDEPMPGGIGLHPWWLRPVELRLTARAVHPRNADPDAGPVEPTGRFDLDGSAPSTGLDATWLDLDPPEVHLRWPGAGLRGRLTTTSDGPIHVAVATPDQPDATAVEPVTHLPWALDHRARGRAGGIRFLGAGEALRLDLELELVQGT